jgi:hypothetical protein
LPIQRILERGAADAAGLPPAVVAVVAPVNAAANLNVPAQYPATVTVAGSGSMDSGDRVICCPGACTQFVVPRTVVSLTAKEDKGTLRAG